MTAGPPNRIAAIIVAVAALVIAGGLVFFGDLENPAQRTRERLEQLENVIVLYAREHGGPPESLEALGLPPEQIQDHLGEPIRYSVSGSTVLLTSYGSDKKPGGFLFKRDYKRTFDLPQPQ